MGFLYGTSVVMHIIICILLEILLCAYCMNYLELLAQYLCCNITNLPHVKHNLNYLLCLICLLAVQPNHITRRLIF